MSSLQPDGSYLKLADMPREQLEEEYRKISYLLTRVVKGDGVSLFKNVEGHGFIFDIAMDPKPGDFRIWHQTSVDGEHIYLSVRPHV